MVGDRRRSLPTIDVSPNDADVEIVSAPKPIAGNTDGPSMVAFPLTKVLSYIPEATPPPPRRARSVLSKLLFFVIISVVLTLLACEVSIAFHVPWLDPRPAIVNLKRSVVKLVKPHGP